MTAKPCIFCEIRDQRAPAALLYEDDEILAFMDIRPVRPAQVLVVPRDHIDHFCDLPDPLATRIFLIGQRLARVMRKRLQPQRVGMIVHGFGVAHAHLIVLPLEHPWDITASQCSYVEDGAVKFRWENLPLSPYDQLQAMADLLRADLVTAGSG